MCVAAIRSKRVHAREATVAELPRLFQLWNRVSQIGLPHIGNTPSPEGQNPPGIKAMLCSTHIAPPLPRNVSTTPARLQGRDYEGLPDS